MEKWLWLYLAKELNLEASSRNIDMYWLVLKFKILWAIYNNMIPVLNFDTTA